MLRSVIANSLENIELLNFGKCNCYNLEKLELLAVWKIIIILMASTSEIEIANISQNAFRRIIIVRILESYT